MKKVIAQKQIWHEYGYQNYLTSFVDKADLTEVQVIPFTDVLTPEIDFVPDIVMGSGRLVRIARERGWPIFPSFGAVDFRIFESCNWFNQDGWESTLSDINSKGYSHLFLKPFTEKLFQAGIVDMNRNLFEQLQFTKTEQEVADERVWVCEPRTMTDEFRFFIIGGKIITGSLYRQNGQGIYRNISSGDVEWLAAQDIMDQCMEDELTATLDITFCPERKHWYIVELNNLNSSGVYATDYDALCSALVNYC